MCRLWLLALSLDLEDRLIHIKVEYLRILRFWMYTPLGSGTSGLQVAAEGILTCSVFCLIISMISSKKEIRFHLLRTLAIINLISLLKYKIVLNINQNYVSIIIKLNFIFIWYNLSFKSKDKGNNTIYAKVEKELSAVNNLFFKFLLYLG